MDTTVHVNSDFSAYLLPSIEAVVTSGPQSRGINPKIKDETSGGMALWGDDNDFPQQVIKDVRKDPELPRLLNKVAELMYSGGLVWGKIRKGPNSTEIMEPLEKEPDNVIKDWVRRSNVNRYLIEAAIDLSWFQNVFPEIVLNVGRTEIVQICTQAAESCRWSKQSKNGLIETCYVNANFPDESESGENTIKLPVLDPYFDPATNLRENFKGTNFIYPLSFPSPGSKFYQMAPWNSVRESGWLYVSQAIPKFKKSLLEKQLNIKYHIEISDLFWPQKYPGFAALSESQKQDVKTKELTAFQSMMAGAEKNGNSIVTPFLTLKDLGKEYSLWKITAIDDKIKTGQFLEEGKDASLYKMAAVGLHPALVGTMPNNGLGGAGSNIREAYNLLVIMNRSYQDIILEPLNNLIKYYNGWDPEVEFRFRNSMMTTLDKGVETKESAT